MKKLWKRVAARRRLAAGRLPVLRAGQLYAYFSKESAKERGVVVYRGVNGNLIPVTQVSDQPSQSNWRDEKFVGVVAGVHAGGYVGRIECGEWRTARRGDYSQDEANVPESLHAGLVRLGARPADLVGVPSIGHRKSHIDAATLYHWTAAVGTAKFSELFQENLEARERLNRGLMLIQPHRLEFRSFKNSELYRARGRGKIATQRSGVGTER